MLDAYKENPAQLFEMVMLRAREVANQTETELHYSDAWLGGMGLHLVSVSFCDQIYFIEKQENSPFDRELLRHPGSVLVDQLAALAFQIHRIFDHPDRGTIAFAVVRRLLQESGYLHLHNPDRPRKPLIDPSEPPPESFAKLRIAFEQNLARGSAHPEGLRDLICGRWAKPPE